MNQRLIPGNELFIEQPFLVPLVVRLFEKTGTLLEKANDRMVSEWVLNYLRHEYSINLVNSV